MEESEIDIIIEEDGTIYPIEIKKSSNPTASDADAFTLLDKDIDKKEERVQLFAWENTD